jgi:hypothetical protein
MSDLDGEGRTKDLLQKLDDGKRREVTEADYYYWLEVLPPAAWNFTFDGHPYSFGFAEGFDYVYGFVQAGERYFAQKTTYLKPSECGLSIKQQQADPGFAERYERSMRDVRRAWGRE